MERKRSDTRLRERPLLCYFAMSGRLLEDETSGRSCEASLSINELPSRPGSSHDFECKRALLAALVLRM